ncbi:endonuclease III domain-containing protein [Candidatus Woesearchaeota archaeon]|nr:endonuclease III domain-containing protein [Candidatus Woesearchaeota archaeon]
MEKLQELYDSLIKKYGRQGWWPINNKYRPGNYDYPNNNLERFEICVGAILTQNTSWINVVKALDNLRKKGLLDPHNMSIAKEERIGELIKPSGYFNQKAKKLKEFAWFFLSHGTDDNDHDVPKREELLEIWGIGPETADSILLYAYKKPEFVIDAYTKSLLLHERIIKGDESYDMLKSLFQENLPKDYKLYNEYHALIVEWGKNQAKN